MKKISILLVLVMTVQVSFAQKLVWKALQEVKKSFYQYPIGDDDQNHYVLSSNSGIRRDFNISMYVTSTLNDGKSVIVKYNKSWVVTGEYPIEFTKKLNFYFDGFISNKKVYLVFTSSDQKKKIYGCYADIFDLTGKYIKTETLAESKEEADYSVRFSEDKKSMIVVKGYYKNHEVQKKTDMVSSLFKKSNTLEQHNSSNIFAASGFTMYNDKLELLAEEKFAQPVSDKLQLSNERAVYYLDNSGENTQLAMFTKAGGTIRTIISKPQSLTGDFWNSYLRIYNDSGKVIVASMIGVSDKSNSTFFTAGMLEVFDDKKLTSIYNTNFEFDKETIKKTLTERQAKKSDKYPGLSDIKFKDVLLTPSNGFVVVFEEHTIVESRVTTTIAKSSGGIENYSSISTSALGGDRKQFGPDRMEYREFFNNIIMVRGSSDGGATKQAVIKRELYDDSKFSFFLSSMPVVANNDLYVLYNEGSPAGYTFNMKKFDQNLIEKNTLTEKFKKTKEVNLAPKSLTRLSNNQYLCWGNDFKKWRALIIDFGGM